MEQLVHACETSLACQQHVDKGKETCFSASISVSMQKINFIMLNLVLVLNSKSARGFRGEIVGFREIYW